MAVSRAIATALFLATQFADSFREAVAIDGVVDPEAVPVVAVAPYDHVSLGFGRPTDELSSFTSE